MNEVKIDKLKLKIGDKTIELTLEQAKELSEILGKLFNPETVTVEKFIPYQPVVQPIWVQPYPREWEYPHWGYPTITCGNLTSNDNKSTVLYLAAT